MTFAVLLITDPAYDVVRATTAALAGAAPGEVAVQLRDKAADDATVAATARALRGPCRDAGAPLIVNGRVEVARAIGADGVHLPERGPSVAEARAALGPGALVGASRHGPPRSDEAPDYVTLSPIRAVAGKAAPLGIEGFSAAAAAWPVEAYALGGVDGALAPALVRAGAAGVAVIRAVFAADDPAAALAALIAAVRGAGTWRAPGDDG